jgi:hypothetical protein
LVAFGDGEATVHGHMNIDVQVEAHFSDPAFFEILHAVDGPRGA